MSPWQGCKIYDVECQNKNVTALVKFKRNLCNMFSLGTSIRSPFIQQELGELLSISLFPPFLPFFLFISPSFSSYLSITHSHAHFLSALRFKVLSLFSIGGPRTTVPSTSISLSSWYKRPLPSFTTCVVKCSNLKRNDVFCI